MMVSHVCTTSSLNYELSLDACESCANDIIHHTESPCKTFYLGQSILMFCNVGQKKKNSPKNVRISDILLEIDKIFTRK